MATPTIIADDVVVLLDYTLKNDDGEVLDASEGEVLPYLHGHGNIVPGLEAALEGKAIGDELTVDVAPEDGYGERAEAPMQEIPIDQFGDQVPEEGDQFFAQRPSGDLMPIWVVEVTDTIVKVDTQHPLAGETLHFEVKVVGLRAANPDELEHGHPHGPDGTHHHH